MRLDLDAEEESKSVNKKLGTTDGVLRRQSRESDMRGHFFSFISV